MADEATPETVSTAARAARDDAAGARLALGVRFAYGLGEAGEGIKTAALETFLFFFYVQVVGLSGVLTGAALFLALLVDGVSDPWVGSWSDRLRSRLGRRHPFLYAAPAPMAAAIYLLFTPPPGLAPGQLFAWLTCFTVGARVSMTLYFVPHMALGAELSRDFEERVALGAWRAVFGYLGRIAAIVLAFSVFFRSDPGHPVGQLDPAAYAPFALACGGLVILVVIASALGTQRAALRLAPDRPVAAGSPQGTWRTFTGALDSGSFRALFAALLIMYLFNGVQGALALHMNTYFWRLAPHEVQFVLYASMAGFLVGIPLARPLARRWDKKAAYMAGVAGSCVLGAGPTVLRLLNLAPQNGDPGLLPLLTITSFASGLIGSVPVVLSAAMLGDLADEYDLKHQVRAEGLLFGVNAFCRKASLGLGGAAAGLVIDVIHFPRTSPPDQAAQDALTRLGVAYGPTMLAILFLGLAFMAPYALDRRRHHGIVEALAARERARSGET